MAKLVCACEEEFRSVCEGPVKKEHDSKYYCVLHAPSKDKNLAAFTEVIEKKLEDKDFDFRGVYFPARQSLASYLTDATFKEPADFSGATFKEWADFKEVTFEKEAVFLEVTFEGLAYFIDATFERGANFALATFKWGAQFGGVSFKRSAYFNEVTFKRSAYFNETTFMEKADFSGTTFKERANFNETTFKEGGMFRDLLTFPETFLSFRAAVIEKPERLSFHSTHLRPSWFIDVDAQKFDFSDVEWFRLPDGDELKLEKEIETLEALEGGYGEVPTPSRLRKLQKACRKLMDNTEENRDYATANEFHYWSMELLRKEGWRRLGLIGTLYWALSGYGERPRRAFWVLVGMWALFAILYVMVAGSIEHVGQAFLYSLAAMVRLTGVPAMAPLTKLLQPPEPGLFQAFVMVEGILGPLQIALLALAIRRKVMR